MYQLAYYLQTNIICIIILLLILFQIGLKTRKKYSTLMLKKIVICSLLFCVTDIISILFRGTNYNYSHIILYISNSLYLLFPLLIGYYWNMYVHLKIDKNSLTKKNKILFLIPLLIGIVLLVINIFTDQLFIINNQNIYERKFLMIIYILITWSYIIIPTLKSMIIYFKSDNIAMKDRVFPLCLFIIAPAIASIFQLFNYGLTVSQVGFTISSLLILLKYQEEQISLDSLTKINNRKKFNEYIQNKFNNTKDNEIISLMFIDIHDFKKINDVYGHIAGDNALIEVSSLLKKTCNNFNKNLFLARYGGDEFVIVSSLSKNEMKKLEKDIHNNLKKESNEKMNIKLSIGFTSDNKSKYGNYHELIKNADETMYKIKCKKKKIV